VSGLRRGHLAAAGWPLLSFVSAQFGNQRLVVRQRVRFAAIGLLRGGVTVRPGERLRLGEQVAERPAVRVWDDAPPNVRRAYVVMARALIRRSQMGAQEPRSKGVGK